MSDKAEKLQNLISRMMGTVAGLEIHNVGPANQQPFWRVFEPLARAMELRHYAELHENYLSLCRAVRREVETLVLRKESVRSGWLDCLDHVSCVFDADNFPERTHIVFGNYFGSVTLSTLDIISERLQQSGYRDSTDDELKEALSAVRDAIVEFENSGKLPNGVSDLLKAYLRQMENTYQLSMDFGDVLFWRAYKEAFGTFLETMKLVKGADNEADIMSKVSVALNILQNKTVAGLSIGANLVTVAAYVAPNLLTWSGS